MNIFRPAQPYLNALQLTLKSVMLIGLSPHWIDQANQVAASCSAATDYPLLANMADKVYFLNGGESKVGWPD